jgi:hypothetical protein
VELSIRNKNSSFLNEIIFGYPFESCTRGFDCERRRVIIGPRFLKFWSYSMAKFGMKWNYGLERKILHF